MKLILITLLILTGMNTISIFNFEKNVDIQDWNIVDDVVMGGKSNGSFTLNNEGHGVFSGVISLKNNGGFSSVRYQFETLDISDKTFVYIKLKGDGKQYQFRIKDEKNAYFSYIFPFQTTGDWEEITIPLNKMYASFRGRTLNIPNFSENQLEEIVFLIGNKKAEDFELQIDSIYLK
ncbi:CIA30 family protein [Patiriisocius marinus]|uniref:NADH:ubiquinone oxidoreductase n=1 Tax=Patiriisocius marinus TaxID=1397112 RepID=A0A5J4J0Z6_9FLAO|nr:CIA30 family protein [Patiriisocius marinus]GER61014.1 NADH:ubiquinone oxidoreductase [Patiriisocius marinus]